MKAFLIIAFLSMVQFGAAMAQKLPIRRARTIHFQANQGTNMNIDISPDGKTLVFDMLGDLYIMPVTGGKAKRITNGMELNCCPVWSPGGKKIAYLSDFSGSMHLNVMNLSGTFHRVIGQAEEQLKIEFNKVPKPFWSSDGSQLSIDNKIYLRNDSLIILPNVVKNPFGFSSNGQELYYSIKKDSSAYNLVGIYRFSIQNKSSELVCQEQIFKGQFVEQDFAISNDQKWFVYSKYHGNNCSLYLKSRTSQEERLLVSSLFTDTVPRTGTARYIPRFCFSPDSKSLFIAYGGKIHRIKVTTGDNEIVPFAANVKIDLGKLNYNTYPVNFKPHFAKFTRFAVISPDNKHLTFSSLNKIFIMDLPSGSPHLLISNRSINQFQPAWSPDSKWIAYVTWCDTVGGQVWRIRSSGGTPEQLSRLASQYQRPVWSPDGTKIAVISKGVPKLAEDIFQENGKLQLIDLSNGQIKDIAENVQMEEQWLSFSKDGKNIIYRPVQVNGNIKPQLISTPIEGTASPQILVVASASRHIASTSFQPAIKNVSISPDGHYVVYSRSEDLYLVPVTQSDMPVIIYDEKKKPLAIRFASGLDPHWEKDGRVLSWSYGGQFFQIDPKKIFIAAEKANKKSCDTTLEGNKVMTVDVFPDQKLNLDIMVNPSYGKGLIALKNARIIPMHGDQKIEHGTVLIKNGRFIALGGSDTTSIPKGAKVIDLKGKTIVPGFVDVHLHLDEPTTILPQQFWTLMINLAYGVTTARDPSSTYDSFGYKELLESGKMIGPRLFTSGRSVNESHGTLNEGLTINNIEEANLVVQNRYKLGGTLIKQYHLSTRLQREWLLLASQKAGMNMTNEGTYDILTQLGMIKDGSSGIEHNPEWGDAQDDVIKLYAKSGTFLTPTLQVRPGARDYFDYTYWHQPDRKLKRFLPEDNLSRFAKTYDQKSIGFVYKTTPANFIYAAKIDAAISKMGGRIAIGSHGNDEGIGVHNELWALHMGGLTNMEALRAATMTGAEAIGVQKDLGSIEVGKIADLVILNSNPLDDIHNTRDIKYVMKGGILYDGDTLDEIWPIYKKCPDWKLHQNSNKK